MDPRAGNASMEPPSIAPSAQGCAWSPPEENSEEPLHLPTFSPAAQVRVAVTFALFTLSAGCNLVVLLAGGREGSQRNNTPRARLRMLRMSLVIVSSFILCWTPYYLLGLWHWFCPHTVEKRVSPALTHILFIFGLFNACLDPITYGLFTIPLRRGWG
ncbi:PREDICTED: vasopressin V2 receptor-like, partial [Acanthisitta chloris]|uniref:vasopressin V2 receptor-like n=1 Tax=Acanthisitta chloris TaxID=57068 RepID=UPI0004F0D68C